MMKRLLCLAVLLVPATALADGPWGDSAGCKRWRGGSVMTDDLTLFDGASFQYHESGCDVVGSRNIGGGVLHLTLSCGGEGETWRDTQKIKYGANKSTVTMINDDGSRKVLRRCR